MDVIGVLELSSIAAGLVALDLMAKAAPVEIVTTLTVCPGRLVIVVTGDEASVELALQAGKREQAVYLVDELYITNLDPRVLPAIRGEGETGEWDALGVIESLSVAAGIRAADIAAKAAAVRLVEVRLAGGMGGKSTVKVLGSLQDVEASVAAAAGWVREKGLLCNSVVLPRPHPDIRPFVLDLPHEGARLWS
jgi:microcompartment protein CcmL/EutN